ncbi:polyprenyl diphosphate synthase [Streptomyces luomodiensis]|uniref:Isoprenyl transferase n=1 Tax=Streptomyces luomodiensis TaxID=3026192 RepID=A0ABY9UQJ5_9ACTN|nr:polyprenyl diphosphate synthase [Streptomyces sp. SCA4-21]WNE94817.1 polyprenyl diphosphate synthase [Streptomyces sp. SCA4-21]
MFDVGAWRVPSVKRLLRESVADAPAVVRQRRGSRDEAPGRPRHLAIIMDGNGRWAALRGLSRTQGHQAGILALPRVVDTALEEGIEHLSLFFFSTENWNRPRGEVAALMRLTAQLADVFRGYGERGVRLCWLGSEARLPAATLAALRRAEAETRHNRAMTLAFCFNHGGREEIARAAGSLARATADGALDPGLIDEALFTRHLPHADLPDIDMLVRTSGERRISNFMLWRAAYAELFFVDTLWPDFTGEELRALLAAFAARDRRFGAGVGPP